MPTFYLDGQPIEFNQGETIIKAAERAGKEIPRYCYHPALPVVGQCRMCLVEVTDMGNGRPNPKLQTACSAPAAEGMRVELSSQKAKAGQELINEMLLVNHPLDCPICDQSGECDLQDYAFKYGTGHSEMTYEKRTYGWRNVGTYIMLERNRCIHCSRCERFSTEIEGGHDFGVFLRGNELTYDTYQDTEITHKFQGNLVDLCPVGCITEREFRFKKRAWKLTRTPSVCTGCSTGCNITIDHESNKVERLKPRENQAVNRWWMCDEGRMSYRALNDRKLRLMEPKARVKGKLAAAGWEAVYQAAKARLDEVAPKGAQVVGLVDTQATNEEIYLFRVFLEQTFGSTELYTPWQQPQTNKPENFLHSLIAPDKTPNSAGAAALGVASDAKNEKVRKALSGAKTVFVLGNPWGADEAIQKEAAQAPFVCYLATGLSGWSGVADLALPGYTMAEKYGTFTNKDKRVQRIVPAIEPPEECRDQVRILAELGHALGQPAARVSAADVLEEMSNKVGAFKGITWASVGDHGLPLKG